MSDLMTVIVLKDEEDALVEEITGTIGMTTELLTLHQIKPEMTAEDGKALKRIVNLYGDKLRLYK